jgi:UDP-N-acetyl-D-glucosamine dehydrogenase
MTQILSATAFDERIANRTARVGIVGLGYAGLPLAMAFAEAGFSVTGIDLSEDRVAAITESRSYLVDVPVERYASVEGRLEATTDYSAVSTLDALTICVPTPLSKTRTPDLSYVVSAAESVAEQLSPGQLVILQSTTYPGTTEQVVRPILEAAGAVVGRDIFLGYAPERVDPGNRDWDVHTTPKLVSGVTDECLRRTQLLYGTIVETVQPVSSPMVAETAKLHENTFRAVNIALANELAIMCDRLGISAWEVIDAAKSKSFGFLAHYPGPGLGGDCIPVVPHFLAWRLRE